MLVNGVSGNTISIRDRGLLYGDGVFRTLRAFGGRAWHWPLHYRKLQQDCHALGIPCPGFEPLSVELQGLLATHSEAVLKLIVTRGMGMRGYAPPAEGAPTHIWDMLPLPQYPVDHARRGIKARVCELRLSIQPRLAGVKHLNRLENVLAAAEWDDAEIAEGLLLDAEGHVVEGTRSNLFLARQGKLVTPNLSRCGVSGVQRERVMAWAEQQGVPLEVRDVALDEVLQADEVFLVNSIIGLWPVRELQERRWEEFPLGTRIAQHLNSEEV